MLTICEPQKSIKEIIISSYYERRKFRKIFLRVCKRRMDNDYTMPIRLELSEEEISLLKMSVALVLGGVFQNKVEAKKISSIFKNNPEKLEALYLKLEHPGQERKEKLGKVNRNRKRVKGNPNGDYTEIHKPINNIQYHSYKQF